MLSRITVLTLLVIAPGANELSAQLPVACNKVVDYDIDVVLDDDGRTITGTVLLDWRNTTSVATDELYWHVYNNAWSNRDSVFMQEAHIFGDGRLPRDWGFTEISAVHQWGNADGRNPALQWNWQEQPGYPADRTVMRVQLTQAVEPGAGTKVAVDFKAVMPPAYRRSGGDGDGGYIHAAQWFPKVGVFEIKDGVAFWNCEPYHYLTEFYADYGSWRLRLTVPERYRDKVAATGTRSSNVENNSGTVTYIFTADDVHDFAWTADPDFEVFEKSFRQMLKENNWRDYKLEQSIAESLIGAPGFEHITSMEDLLPRDTQIILMLQPEHGEYADRYLEATVKSLYYFGLKYGEYPYETITVIDPAHNARHTGGMEYPRLFTGGVRKGNAARTLSPEGITVHEFGHQFWYGLVGNDEFNHAWLDEGFNTFSTQRIKRDAWKEPALATYSVLGRQYYGKAPMTLPSFGADNALSLLSMERLETPDLGFIRPLSYELRRDTSLLRWLRELPPLTYLPEVERDPVLSLRGVFASKWSDPLAKPSWQLLDGKMRRVNAYSRPALTLETFSRLMGEDRWTRVIRAYHERYRYGHPKPADFLRVVKQYGGGAELAGHILDWDAIWNHAYQQNDPLDYGIHRLDCTEDPDHDGFWDVTLEVRRIGAFKVPVEILLTWSDGSEELLNWDGQGEWWRHTWSGSALKPKSAVLDPERRLMLDRDWMNNSRLLEVDKQRASRLGLRALLWAQQVLHYSGGMG